MNRLGLAAHRLWERSLALVFFVVVALPALAWSQPDSATSSTSSQSSTSTTTVTTTDFVSDWRFWAAVGAVLLVILIIAVTRGKGEDRTTIVK